MKKLLIFGILIGFAISLSGQERTMNSKVPITTPRLDQSKIVPYTASTDTIPGGILMIDFSRTTYVYVVIDTDCIFDYTGAGNGNYMIELNIETPNNFQFANNRFVTNNGTPPVLTPGINIISCYYSVYFNKLMITSISNMLEYNY